MCPRANRTTYCPVPTSEEYICRSVIQGVQVYVHGGEIISALHQGQYFSAGDVASLYRLDLRWREVHIQHDFTEEHINSRERARNYPEQVHLTLLDPGADYAATLQEKVSEARRMIAYNRRYHSYENKSIPEMHHDMIKGLMVYVCGGEVVSADGDRHQINAENCLIRYSLSLRWDEVRIGNGILAAGIKSMQDNPRVIRLFPCNDGKYVENFCKQVEKARNRLEEAEKPSQKIEKRMKPVQLALFDAEMVPIPRKSGVKPSNCMGKRKFFGFDLSVHDSMTGMELVTRGIDGVIKGLKYIA